MSDFDRATARVRSLAHATLGPGAEPKRAARRRYYEAVAAVERVYNAGGEPTDAELAERDEAYAGFRRVMGWAK